MATMPVSCTCCSSSDSDSTASAKAATCAARVGASFQEELGSEVRRRLGCGGAQVCNVSMASRRSLASSSNGCKVAMSCVGLPRKVSAGMARWSESIPATRYTFFFMQICHCYLLKFSNIIILERVKGIEPTT